MKLKAGKDKVLVFPEPPQETSKGGIILTNSAARRFHKGTRVDNGAVVFYNLAIAEIEVDDIKYHVLSEENVLAEEIL